MAITQTSSGESVIASTQQTLFINLTAPIETDQSRVDISGYVSRDEVKSNVFNIAYVVDTSGSMGWNLQANEQVQDQNSDGFDNHLIDGAILAYEKLNQSLIDAGLGISNAAIIEFNDNASLVYDGLVKQDNNTNNILDVYDNLKTLSADGATNFEDALQKTADFFAGKQNQAENYVFFISDGEPTEGGDYLDEVTTLLTIHGANIRALGLGSAANLTELDYVDDGKLNNSAKRVLEPSELIAGLTASSINAADIDKVEIYVNQQLVSTIPAVDLISTAIGLKYELSLDSLVIGQDDVIEARVIANDNASSTSTTRLTVKETPPPLVVIDTQNGGGGGTNGGGVISTNISSKLFLDKNDAITLSDNAKVFGASGDEMIKIVANAGAIIDQGVERVEFDQVLANYTFYLAGNVLTVNLQGQVAATITIQGDGTKLAFNNGSADFVLTGLSLGNFGGATIDNNEASLTGVQLDTFDPSVITSLLGSGSGVDGVNIAATGIDDYGNDRVEDAAANDISFYFAQGSYYYTVQNFSGGDSLHFAQGTSLSIQNTAADGSLDIIATDAISGTSVEVTLSGISAVLDSTIISVDSFRTAFGVDSLS